MLTAIRKTIAVGRYAEKFNALKGISGMAPVGTIVFIDFGNGCRIGGMGNIFKNFISSGKICGYSGQGSKFAAFGDDGYDDAHNQIVHFDQTYKRSSYDVTRGK